MKRDYHLIRELLRKLEGKSEPGHWTADNFDIENYDRRDIGNHLRLLYEAGFISGEAIRSKSTPDRIIEVWPFDLTWHGHEFIAAAKNDKVWKKVVRRLGDGVVSVPFNVLTKLLIQELEGRI